MKMELPLSYRWFRAQTISTLIPWHFLEPDDAKFKTVRDMFRKEDGGTRDLVCFAHRQDCDDFAGFEIKIGQITDRVIYFHPAFNGMPNDSIITGEYEDFWKFLCEVIIRDTADWSSEYDLKDLEEKNKTPNQQIQTIAAKRGSV